MYFNLPKRMINITKLVCVIGVVSVAFSSCLQKDVYDPANSGDKEEGVTLDNYFDFAGLYKDTYQTHGIEHAISENYGHTQIMWRNGQCTCSITGDISRADAERMINSIYENGG